MKSYQVFRETALTNIKPLGWLEAYLWLQRDGLTGHLENAGFPVHLISHFPPSEQEKWRTSLFSPEGTLSEASG